MDPASPRTNSIADLRLCSGLAAQGHEVELVVPAITRPIPPIGELFATYGLDPTFDVRFLPMPEDDSRRRDSRIFLPLLRHHMLEVIRASRHRVVLSRGVRLLLPYVVLSRTLASRVVTAPWLHEFRGKRLERLICRNSSCVLATNSAIQRALAHDRTAGVPTFVTGNPVPRERVDFGRRCSKADARKRLGLDLTQTVIAYTGKLFLGMKELEYLLGAAERMPQCLFVLTGGQPHVVEALEEQLKENGTTNVVLTGFLPDPRETRFHQQAADVLVSYYSTQDHRYAHHQLPGKLAEYMATGNPIVAADFPAVRDLLNPANSLLVEPHDVDALVRTLTFAVEHPTEAAALGQAAQRDVAARTSESVGAELGSFLQAAFDGAKS